MKDGAASVEGRRVDMRDILDSVQQLLYDKVHRETELTVRTHELETVRAEVEALRKSAIDNEATLKEVLDCAESGNQAHPSEPQVYTNSQLEKMLAEIKDKYNEANKRLDEFQSDYQEVRRRLHEKEKEVLELQRRERDAIADANKGHAHQLYYMQWKEVNNLTTTQYRCHFRGDEWIRLLLEKPESMRAAFLKDVSLELRAPYGFVTVVAMEAGPEHVAVDVEVRHPTSLCKKELIMRLMECSFDEMSLLLEHLEGPKDGFDLLRQQLKEAQQELAKSEEGRRVLNKQLELAQLSLLERQKQIDEESNMVHAALDDTEKTVKATYNELKSSRENNKMLELQLQKYAETVTTQEKFIAELTTLLNQLGDKVEGGSEFTTTLGKMNIRDIMGKMPDLGPAGDHGVGAILWDGDAVGSDDTLKNTQEFRQTVVSTWRCPDSIALKNEPLLPDSRVHSIVRSVLMCEVAAAVQVVPSDVTSLEFIEGSLRAEVCLQLNSRTHSVERILGILREFNPKSTVAFLENWFQARRLMQEHAREVETLVEELIGLSKAFLLNNEQGDGNRLVVEAMYKVSAVVAEIVRLSEKLKDGGILCTVPNQDRRRTQEHASGEDNSNGDLTLERAERSLNEMLEVLNTYQAASKAGPNRQHSCSGEMNTKKLADIQSRRLHREKHINHSTVKNYVITTPGEETTQKAVGGDVWVALAEAYAEYDTLHERYEDTMEQLLAVEDSLREKLLLVKRSSVHEKNIERLTRERDALLIEQQKNRNRESEMWEALATKQQEVDRLKKEIDRKTEWAEEMMHRLVQEEDERSKLEGMLKGPQKRLATVRDSRSGISAESSSTHAFLHVLRAFCKETLDIEVPDTEQSVEDILNLIGCQYSNKIKRSMTETAFAKEEVVTVIQSLNAAIPLLQQALTSGRTRACSDTRVRGRAGAESDYRNTPSARRRVPSFPRPAANGARSAATPQQTRVPQLSGRRLLGQASPTRSVTPLQKKQKQVLQEACTPPQVCHPLTSCATRILQLAQKIAGPVPQLKSPKLAKNNSKVSTTDVREEFVQWSREQIISLMLFVKDYLHDAAVALNSVARTQTTVPSDHEDSVLVCSESLRAANSYVTHAMKSIVETVVSLLSQKELSEIEESLGKGYFHMPYPLRSNPFATQKSRTVQPHDDPTRQPSPPLLGLAPRQTNAAPGNTEKLRSMSRDEASIA
uniref:Flagellar attachment zone protein 1 conserved domain-containing protein n=1 Tax=Trypanosoma congolense (strain IL3000) TaxID=1068625 RepID=G0UV99_TRYCI|nr:conserved hypothetical protein [Trypanosoma congolense IL3000]